MGEEINPKILEKIKKIKDEKIKDFLIDVIHLEFDNIEEGRWLYREEYDKKINTSFKEK